MSFEVFAESDGWRVGASPSAVQVTLLHFDGYGWRIVRRFASLPVLYSDIYGTGAPLDLCDTIAAFPATIEEIRAMYRPRPSNRRRPSKSRRVARSSAFRR